MINIKKIIISNYHDKSVLFRRRITLGNHRPGHTMHAIQDPEAEEIPTLTPATTIADIDKDYLSSKFNIPGNYNYLDPNYMPTAAATSDS